MCNRTVVNQYTINVRKEKGRPTRVELKKRFARLDMYRNSRWLLIIYNEVQVRSGFLKRGIYEIWVSFPLLRTIDCGRI
ncbi:hypothetical protein ALC57_10151 [Trachymyrmex cornetzi]|uniref:Uncharacterized protein n=1 Tax=Trachymyrmex cornetzi TaxID=471704 RepID=A0A151J4L0_9HYME|nr:hypothetical protein ALC57_10151 [Trachymyrmex cornetzi]